MSESIQPIVKPISIADKSWETLLEPPFVAKGQVPPLKENAGTRKLVRHTFMKYKACHEEIDYINSQLPLNVKSVRWSKLGWAIAIVAERNPDKAFEKELLRSILDATWIWDMADQLGVKRKWKNHR